MGDAIVGDLGRWTIMPGVPADETGALTPMYGSEIRITPDQKLVLTARDDQQTDALASAAGVLLGLPVRDGPGSIRLTRQTLISARFECDVFLANAPLALEGVQAYIKINARSPAGGGATMLYVHERTLPPGSDLAGLLTVSDTFTRRLYDDFAAVMAAEGLPLLWAEPMYIEDVFIVVSARAQSNIDGAGVAECSCIVDDLTFSEE
jgi:hypothetical protein